MVTAADNGAGGRGGGIFSSGILRLTDSAVSNNRTGNGGDGGQGGQGGDGGGGVDSFASTGGRGGGSRRFGTGRGGSGGGIFSGGGLVGENTLSLVSSAVSHNQTGNGGSFGEGGGTSGGAGSSGGGAGSSGDGGSGGGIFHSGTLNLISSTVSHNQTGDGGNIDGDNGGNDVDDTNGDGGGAGGEGGNGGGIDSGGAGEAEIDSTLTLIASVVSNNQTGNGSSARVGGDGDGGSGGDGGGINSGCDSTLRIFSSTVSNNQTGSGGNGSGGIDDPDRGLGGSGGGIINGNSLVLEHSTIAGNTGERGSGISSPFSPLTLHNSIISGNTTSASVDIVSESTTYEGTNLIGSADIFIVSGPPPLTDPAQLAPLGHYGGPTQSMPPLPGSPAIDAAGTIDPGGTDQRGFPRFFNNDLDIGAVELQGPNVELELDFDFDGTSNGVELAIGTNPVISDSDDLRNLTLTSFDTDGNPEFTFGIESAQQNDIILRLVRSTDLINFTTVVVSNDDTQFDTSEANLLEIQDTDPPEGGEAFYRLEAERRPPSP